MLINSTIAGSGVETSVGRLSVPLPLASLYACDTSGNEQTSMNIIQPGLGTSTGSYAYRCVTLIDGTIYWGEHTKSGKIYRLNNNGFWELSGLPSYPSGAALEALQGFDQNRILFAVFLVSTTFKLYYYYLDSGATSWTETSRTLPGPGCAMVYYNQKYYIVWKGSSTNVHQVSIFDPATNSISTPHGASTTWGTVNMQGIVAVNGIIYGTDGRGMYSYNISSGAYTVLASNGKSSSYGATFSCLPQGLVFISPTDSNLINVFPGYGLISSAQWQYNISGNKWTQYNTIPINGIG